MKCPEDIKTYAKIRPDQKLFQFLNGLDRKFKPIKWEILQVDPLPTTEAAYATVRKEAAYQNILRATNNEPQGIDTGLIIGEIDGVGFMTKGCRRNYGKKKWVTRDDKSHLKCEEYGMSRHTKEQCFCIVGYQNWWIDGNKKGTKSAKTEKEKGTKSAKTEKEKVPTTNTIFINKENTSDGRRSDGGFGGLATAENKGIEGDFSVAKCPPSVNGSAHMAQSSFKEPSGPWIFDCEATDTMTYEDIKTGWIIGSGIEREGLYYVDEVTTNGTVMLAHGTSKREACGQGEEECDTLSWLRYTSEEICPNHNTTSVRAQEQSSLNISVTEDTVPNLISEISNSQPSDSLDESPENIHETVRVQEHEEPTLTEVEEPTLANVPEKYVLPARSNRGIPLKRYTPEKPSEVLSIL
nr:hypothetical protein [Tanacetum cinerariifolium]